MRKILALAIVAAFGTLVACNKSADQAAPAADSTIAAPADSAAAPAADTTKADSTKADSAKTDSAAK